MNIRVEVRGVLRAYLSSNEPIIDLDVPPGTRVGEVVKNLGIPIERGWNASVQRRLVSDKDILQEGDYLMVFEVIGGG